MGILQTLKQFRSEGIEGFVAVKYAEFAKKTKKMQENSHEIAKKVFSEIKEGKILEIGSGPGFLSINLAKLSPNLEIIGLDLSQTMIEIASKNAKEQNVIDNIQFKKGNAAKMPFEDNFFNFVVSAGSLHHWKNPMQVFNEIYRVLKPDGKVLISDARKDASKEKIEEFANLIDSKFMRWGLKKSFNESYNPEEIKVLLSKTSFANFNILLEDITMDIWIKK